MTSENRKIDAISWKCGKLDISYGKLVSTCSPSQLQEIYREFDKYLAEKDKRLRERMNAKKQQG